MITAEKVYKEILEMPVRERERLFTVIARRGFEKDLFTHEEVFDAIRQAPFTIKEAAEYLEVAEITVRRWVKDGILKSKRIGKKTNIAITLDEQYIDQLDRLVSEHVFQNRSQAIQKAVEEKLSKMKRTRLAKECAKLDRTFERAMAEE